MRGSSNNNNSSTNNNNNNSNLNDNNNMDTSFYDDNEQFTVGNNKRPATLDLHSKSLSGKKLRLNQSVAPLVIDSSADLQSVKLTTPDIERFVLNSLPTPGLQFPTKFTANTQGTSEQEDYVKGFVDALNSLHKKDSQCKMTAVASSAVTSVVSGNGMSGGSIIYTNLDDSSFPVAIKDEPQTVPNSPPLSPIDMESQERIKLERKRQRNRVAASKCRKRKLERISKLEDKVKQLKGENGELNVIVKQLRESIFSLKQQVLEHANAGCTIPLAEGK